MSCPDASAAHTSVATIAPTIAAVDASPAIAAHTAAITNAGAMTRNAVSMTGRGASVASNPAAHASQSSTAPATRGASDHDASESAAAGPAVTGSVIHATRNNHRKRGRGSGTPFRCGAVRCVFGVSTTRARLECAVGAIVEYGPMSPTLRAPLLVP